MAILTFRMDGLIKIFLNFEFLEIFNYFEIFIYFLYIFVYFYKSESLYTYMSHVYFFENTYKFIGIILIIDNHNIRIQFEIIKNY